MDIVDLVSVAGALQKGDTAWEFKGITQDHSDAGFVHAMQSIRMLFSVTQAQLGCREATCGCPSLSDTQLSRLCSPRCHALKSIHFFQSEGCEGAE